MFGLARERRLCAGGDYSGLFNRCDFCQCLRGGRRCDREMGVLGRWVRGAVFGADEIILEWGSIIPSLQGSFCTIFVEKCTA